MSLLTFEAGPCFRALNWILYSQNFYRVYSSLRVKGYPTTTDYTSYCFCFTTTTREERTRRREKKTVLKAIFFRKYVLVKITNSFAVFSRLESLCSRYDAIRIPDPTASRSGRLAGCDGRCADTFPMGGARFWYRG